MQNILVIGAIVVILAGGIWYATSSEQDTMMSDNSTTEQPMDTMAVPEDSMTAEGDAMATSEPAGVMVGGAMMLPSMDIVDNAANAENVSTVVAAVQAAGLVETLKSDGPFTVFAPTNDAFAALPAGTVETLLLPENQDQLANILTYHVVAGAFTSADLFDGQMLTTVQGEQLEVGIDANGVTINGSAMVETADVISSNGVTHVIDGVLLPPEA